MAQADPNPNRSTIHEHLQIDPTQVMHYALSEDAELHLQHLRDGLRGLATLSRGNVEEMIGSEMGAILDVFALAADTIIAATPFAGPSRALN